MTIAAFVLTVASFVTALFAWIRGARMPAARAPEPNALLVLRPVAGDEPWLERALASSRAAASVTKDLSVRFLVGEASDSARPVAERVADALSSEGIDAAVLVTDARGPNRKADQLARALAKAPRREGERVLVADADVALDGDVVRALLSACDAGAALAWAPPVEIAPRTIGDRVSAAVLESTLHAFSLLGRLDPRGVVGKCFAVDRATLESVDIASLRHHLGEDMELGRRLAAIGADTAMVSAGARSIAFGRTFAAVVARYRRWLLVIRAQRPALLASYPLLLASTPVALAVAAFSGDRAAIATILAARALVGVFALRSASVAIRPSRLAFGFVADVVLLAAWIGALASARVRWRGVPLALRAGHLEAEP